MLITICLRQQFVVWTILDPFHFHHAIVLYKKDQEQVDIKSLLSFMR